MYIIKELVNNELNDLFFSYLYSEISISDKSKEQIISSVFNNIQRTNGSIVSEDIINEINSILDSQIANMQQANF